MTSIQQSFNQMLMSAQIGASLYAQTPGAKARIALKATKKRESETEDAISNSLKELKKEAQGAGEITPETETALKGVLQEQTALTKQQFHREPAYLENYLSALQDEEMLKTQGRLGLSGWQGLQTTAERQKTINSQKEQLELRKKLLAGEPEVKPTKKSEVIKYGI